MPIPLPTLRAYGIQYRTLIFPHGGLFLFPRRKVITLPHPAAWTDERTGQVVARGTARLEVEAGFGETLLYSIEE